ncbi:dipeptidyl-peptidase-4 [Kitasatospora sp. MAP12-15]|uniref:S9 family peptidase n=1 Tax=unclassified Kitasatospora TaxID=2633591 RepID=UPI002474B920|nr:prolyl oligopeptidase family serine peptidase [Kitasatospora sp. MAP12-44]MDH6109531.1 dipeptidyl-peptidase-4 [Kitasatospora sp. MAP12-44]
MTEPSDPYLALSARTGRFSYGAPRAFTLAEDGGRLLFLRSSGPRDSVERLWLLDLTSYQERVVADPTILLPGRTGELSELPVLERRLRERTRLWATGIGSFAATPDCATAVFALDGRLFQTATATGESVELTVAGPAFDPRPSPDGSRTAYVSDGALHITALDRTGLDRAWLDGALSPADDAVWGVAEFAAAEELGRHRGHWWSPDGSALLAARVDESALPRRWFADPARPELPAESFAYPQAGGPNADVQLWVLALDGRRTRLDWDAERYPYVCAADWAGAGEILLTVADRLQQTVLLLSADPASGKTVELSRTTDEFYVDDLPGTPARLAGGALLSSADTPGGTARAIALDGRILTGERLQVRRVVGRLRGRLLIEAGEDDPADQHVFLLDPADGALERLSEGPGVHSALAAGDTLLLNSAGPDGIRRRIRRGEHEFTLPDHTEPLPYRVRPQLARVTELALPTAVVYPRHHVPGQRLPVLLDVYGGPGGQAVASEPRRWQPRQWWADQGFAVVSTDNRGTPFVSPAFSKAMFRAGLSQVTLDDQVAALHALAERHPDLDLSRVGVRGWSYGGYFAAMAVLRRPDVFHAGSAGAPPTDFRLYDTAYTERYLGLPQDNPDGYAADCLLTDAPSLSRPLLLIHGLADDNVHPSHTLLLSQALHRAGRPHSVLPLPGVSHLRSNGVDERLMVAELDFLRGALG